MTATGWNFAEIWEHNADRFPDAIAQLQGDRTYTWAEFDRRADGIAATLLAAGVAAPGQGGALPLQLPRVPGEHVRPLQGRRSCR